MCYSASAVTDIELSGTKLATAGDGQGFIKDTLCCGYGSDGMKESGKHDNIWVLETSWTRELWTEDIH